MEAIQTKFNEERFFTSEPKEMLGKFLAKRVLKSWNEDFIDEEPTAQMYDFLVKTKDVDTAKIVITAWINNKFKEEKGEERLIDLSILSATPFPCSSIIEKEFCLAYIDEAK